MEHLSNVDRLSNTEIHDWYRMVFAYSDQLVFDLIEEFGITEDDLILDPFNGTGTTTLAAKRSGIDAIGTDASPIAVLASRTKANWDVDVDEFRQRSNELLNSIEPVFQKISAEGNTTLASFNDGDDLDDIDLSRYDFEEPEKVPKGWLSEKPRKKMLVLRDHLEDLRSEIDDPGVHDLLLLAICAILPEDVANVGFGPEAYRTSEQEDVEVYEILDAKLDKMESDLRRVQSVIDEEDFEPGEVEALEADARFVADILREESDLLHADRHEGEIDYVITSPPYPAEHDYTRNQRLELVWMGEMEDTSDLQRIKKQNIRSNTKNIYVADSEGEETQIREIDRIDEIVTEMERIIEEENIEHGFGQYYPRVVEEYFAGMQNHLEQIYDLMAPGGMAGYVVADSGSYWQVEIETGEILAEIAESRLGFEFVGINHWRNLQSTTGKGELDEEILILRKPA